MGRRSDRRRKLLWCLAGIVILAIMYRQKKAAQEAPPFDVHRRPHRFAYPSTAAPPYTAHLTPPHDFRAPECKVQHSELASLPPGSLPNTTVVFCFCNEPAKSLHNSIYSVIDRSPRHLLHEIVLVDDGSDAPHLAKPLEDFVQTLPVPVRIVRQGYRSGLMRARVAGAKVATGETLTFLDSHISCSVGWLEPMMHRIAHGREHVVMPLIDGIDRDWNYKPGGVALVGFNTRLVDHGIQLQRAHDFPGRKATDPEPSPAMAGGLFSIHREYFFDIGAFDEQMLHWGGENIEIGFRVWQCGGSIELLRCSRVGHVWGGMGANCGWKGKPPTNRNKWRAIEVWMDKEHQDIMREFLPYPDDGTGDLSNMIAIRDKFKCKDFNWFLDKVYPECWMNVIQKAKRKGVLRSKDHGKCVDPRAPGGARLVRCNVGQGTSGNTQLFFLSADDELLLNAYNGDIDFCLESPTQGFQEPGSAKLSIYGCHHQGGNQHWLWDASASTLRHGDNGCLEGSADGKVYVGECGKSHGQTWEWVKP